MTAVLTPSLDRTYAQRLDAIREANRVRGLRARLKHDLKTGRASAADVLTDPQPELLTMKVRDLLLALPMRGPAKIDRLLNLCRISHSKTVGGLSGRQREELVGRLR